VTNGGWSRRLITLSLKPLVADCRAAGLRAWSRRNREAYDAYFTMDGAVHDCCTSGFRQPAPSPEVLRDLAPTGKLRAAINYGNSVFAQKGPDGAAARRLGGSRR
jgi:hypothetical protein